LIKVSGKAVLKLIGIAPEDAQNYHFKSIVLKEKKLEPDIVGFPVLENNQQKVFINVMSLFILNRFRNITREGIKAMLDFDILDTVAGRQVYDEGLEKGIEKGLDNMQEMLALNLRSRFGDASSDMINTVYTNVRIAASHK
jgi:hypothetical protein